MILRLEGDNPATVTAAMMQLEQLVRSWGYELSEPNDSSTKANHVHVQEKHDNKGADPVSIVAMVLSIPSAALAVADLVDRIQKRRRAEELIETAQRLVASEVTLILDVGGSPMSIAALDPDRLLDQRTET